MNQSSPIHFKRVYFIVAGLVFFWLMLEVWLFIIQIYRHEFYSELIDIKTRKKIELKAIRGEIFDRSNERLATSLIHFDLGADLSRIVNKQKVANAFAKTFNRPIGYFSGKLKSDTGFVHLVRKVSEFELGQITHLKDPGLVKLPSFRRFYPYHKYAGQLIGFTDVDDFGISGLEMQHDSILKGVDGFANMRRDAKFRLGYDVAADSKEPIRGSDIWLTLDKYFQIIVEDELEAGVKKFGATKGMAVLMNPQTGAILAMSNYPGYNPNNPAFSNEDNRKNRVVGEVFEPGSTFKIFSAAALLQEGLKNPDDKVFCENGIYILYKHRIHDTKKYAWLTFRKVFEYSSNIGMVKLSADLPKHVLYRYLKNFGFDSETGVNLPEEVTGMLPRPEKFSGISKAVIAFGQEVGVTALQITNAVCAVVNDGKLMRPYIISRIKDSDDDVIMETETQEIRQVISAEVAATLREFMLGVVENGTGKKAAIKGIKIGGKTGTAQKYDIAQKRYKKDSYMSSFIGFAPYDKPKHVLGVFIDDTGNYQHGGDVAAPIFAAIIKRIFNLVPNENFDPEEVRETPVYQNILPDFANLPLDAVEEFMDFTDRDFSIEGSGSHIMRQTMNDDEVKLVVGVPRLTGNLMPKLTGLSLREALKKINFYKVRVEISGSGKVIRQSIQAGKQLQQNSVLSLTCSEG